MTGNQMSFLCPNGHKLNAPVNLQGRVGQCPHCAAKFRIPVVSAESAIAVPSAATTETHPPPEPPPPAHEPIGGPASDSVLADDSTAAESSQSQVSEISADEIREITPATGGVPAVGDRGATSAVSTAATPSFVNIFDTLWEERAHGAIVEIHLDGGTVVAPDWWARPLSDTGFGVFALENRDGSYQMEAIAWDSIRRIVVRNISELPGGLFG